MAQQKRSSSSLAVQPALQPVPYSVTCHHDVTWQHDQYLNAPVQPGRLVQQTTIRLPPPIPEQHDTAQHSTARHNTAVGCILFGTNVTHRLTLQPGVVPNPAIISALHAISAERCHFPG